jgi:hypothetical protein
MFKSLTFKKAAILGAASLALGMAVLPTNNAEARWRHHHRGAYIGAGVLGGALLGSALLAPRAYGAPVYAPGPVYVEEPSCYLVRERVWDDYRGRWVRVKRRVCE